MATLTIRNVKPAVVKRIKERARQKGHSMEQEVRETLDQSYSDRLKVLEEIRKSWAWQTRPTTAEEVDRWIEEGRE